MHLHFTSRMNEMMYMLVGLALVSLESEDFELLMPNLVIPDEEMIADRLDNPLLDEKLLIIPNPEIPTT